MSPVAGVDGGGTRTRALVVDDGGRELGEGEGPPGLVETGAADRAADAVAEAVRAAAEDAGVDLPLEALWCGLAGVGRPVPREEAREEVEGRDLARAVRVGTDVEAAFRDAFGEEGTGVLLLAGTGSIALARPAEGEVVRVGGWGALLGDEGSAYRVALDALRAVLRAHDGRAEATDLHDRLLAATSAAGPDELVSFAAGADKARIAALAPEVLRAADAADAPARRIVADAVRELVAHAVAAASGAGLAPEAAGLVLSGGMVGPDRPLGERVEAALARRGFRVERREVRAERGAARMAAEVASGGG